MRPTWIFKSNIFAIGPRMIPNRNLMNTAEWYASDPLCCLNAHRRLICRIMPAVHAIVGSTIWHILELLCCE